MCMVTKDELKKENKDVDDLVDLVRQPIHKLQRKKVNTMIILDVHARFNMYTDMCSCKQSMHEQVKKEWCA